ncbi:MAG: hypothetical protein AABX30_00205 [Nanoarchaeota archaeon]
MKKRIKNKKNKLIFLLIASLILLIVLSFFFDIKTSIIISLSILLLASYIIFKEKIGQELIVAFLIAIAWTSYYSYEYTSPNLMLGKINIFPLIAWTAGLVLLREIYEKIENIKLIKITIIYLLTLFALEYIGYYLLNIRLNNNFPSIFGMGIIHAPPVLKGFYILAGPIYILITNYLKVK